MVLLEAQTWISESVKYDWVDKVARYCDGNINAFSTQLSATVGIAYALCGLFAVVYVANIVWKSWISGGQIDLYKCLKPFAIGICIMNFNLVVGFIDIVMGAMNKGAQVFNEVQTTRSASQNESAYEYIGSFGFFGLEDKYEDERKAAMGEESMSQNSGEEEGASQESDSFALSTIAGGIGKIVDVILSPMHLVELMLADTLACLMAFLTSIVCCVVLLTSFISRCVLIFFGPFIFSLSLVKGFDHGIYSWIKRYVTFSMYPIIMNVINGVLMGLSTMLMTSMKDFYFGGIDAICLWRVIMCVIGICMMANVGKLAATVMDVSTEGMEKGMAAASAFMMKQGKDAKQAMVGKLGSGTGQASQMAGGAAAGMATGGAATVAQLSAGAAQKTGEAVGKGASDSNYKGGGDKA